MGLLTDLAVDAASSVAANKMEGNEEDNKHHDNRFIRFIVTIVWLVISVGVDVYAVFSEGYLLGAIAEIIFAVITFCVPYLRRKGSYTRWFGVLAIFQAIWLIYLMVSH